jgi:hypothetical protein
MQFQLSVFHNGGFLSYLITTDEQKRLQFHLKSAPDGAEAPETFTATHNTTDEWVFEPALTKEFAEAVSITLRRAKL